MIRHRLLPQREQIFVYSLLRHGYRYTRARHGLKKRKRYVIPATAEEDAAGIDFWVKPKKATRLIPVQITQRGIAHFKRRSCPSVDQLSDFARQSRERISLKRRCCRRARIAFVLVRDHDGGSLPTSVAWGDAKALNYAIARYA